MLLDSQISSFLEEPEIQWCSQRWLKPATVAPSICNHFSICSSFSKKLKKLKKPDPLEILCWMWPLTRHSRRSLWTPNGNRIPDGQVHVQLGAREGALLTPRHFSIYAFPTALSKQTQMDSTLCHMDGEPSFQYQDGFLLPKKLVATTS